jgi:RNA polymerase sigma-70 factor (ECF subfamily)
MTSGPADVVGEVPATEESLRQLMQAYQQGDSSAVGELVRRISPALLRYLTVGQANRSDAEDLLQECWLRVHRARHTYRPAEPVLPWIFAVARHTRLDGFRRDRRRQARELLVDVMPDVVSPDAPDSALASDQLRRLLDELPDAQREVIVMLKVSGMTLEEVARATSSTIGAVKQKAHRAYTKLRGLLERGGVR